MELVLKRVNDDVCVPADAEYIECVQDILDNEEFASMKNYIQHGTVTCLDHSVSVSYRSYLTCKEFGLDYKAAARAGLLHDFFLYDWHTRSKETGEKFHGFTHPKVALQNATEHFELSELEKEIILKHMWPLTVIPPKFKETYVVLYHDKACSLKETFGLA